MKIYQIFNKFAIENYIDLIISPSNFVINKHKKYNIYTTTPTRKLPLGINLKRFDTTELSSTQNDGRFLYVGRLTKAKGVDILIDAVKNIDDSEIECHILGKGGERESLEKRAGDDERILFHGFVSEEELQNQYALADYTVVPSRWYENSPMVIYESFAKRTPVIGADIGGIPELVTENITGHLFEPNNPNSLAMIMANCKENDNSDYKFTDEIITKKEYADRLFDIYNSLI
jgi:glycosyltransferase involved in cell wall biosynthesis